MKDLCQYTFWMVLLLPSMAVAGSASTRVYAKVGAETTIYAGDQFVYSVVVEGGAKPSRIDVSPIARFKPRPAGSGTSIQTVGDRTTISYSENYRITATAAGTMTLPGVKVTVDGQVCTTNPVDVKVSRPGSTDRMTVEFSVSEAKCYVGQPTVMTVRWIVTTRWQGVGFDVPVFKSGDFYIEDASEAAGGSTREQIVIDGIPTTVTMDRQSIRGMEATVISFSKVLIPKRPGLIELDPVTISAEMAVGRVRTDDLFNPYRMKYERVAAQSKPVELEVLPLPPTGKPAQFYGLVGRYTISASAAPTKVNVGDPITLAVRIGDNPYLKPVQWPQLEQIPELAANFRIPSERASPILDGGCKVFTQTIRASNDAVTEIPAISLAYFDPVRGDYAVATTDSIQLEVAPTKVLTNADMEGTSSQPVNREVEAIQKGLSANYYGPKLAVNQSFSLLSAAISPAYAAIWFIPLMVLTVSSVVRAAGRTSAESLARKRRRQAAGAAMRRLKTVGCAVPGDRPERLLSAMKGYIGDRFNKVSASLTAEDCRRIIAEAIGDTETAARYRGLIAACEEARYAPMDAEIGLKQVQEAVKLIHVIEKHSKK